MSVLLALLLAVPAASAPPAPDSNEDIVVIGQRLMKLKVRVSMDKQGQPQCRIKRSSGDSGLDSAFCGVARRCVAQGPSSGEELSQCMICGKDEMIAALAASRARGKTDASN
ncbi:MAG: hypothetical protein ACJ8ER_16175 [Allosphingosinicella sp.]